MNGFTSFKIVGGLALGLALCVALVWRLDIQKSDASLLISGLSWWAVLGVFALTILMAVTGAHKWALWAELLAIKEKQANAQPKPNYLRHMVWQSWLGQFVPPSLAVIIGRGMAEKEGSSFGRGAVSGTLDQAMEFLFLAAMLPAGVTVLWYQKDLAAFLWLTVLGWGLTGGLLYMVVRQVRPHYCIGLLSLEFWSIVRVALTVLRVALGGIAFSLTIGLLPIAAASPVVGLLALIPLTPGNLGIAEWGWVGVLRVGGISVLEAGLLALGFRVLVLVCQTVLLVCYEGFHYVQSKRS